MSAEELQREGFEECHVTRTWRSSGEKVLERQGRKECERISENTHLVTFMRVRAYYTENRKREIRIDSEGRECKKDSAKWNFSKESEQIQDTIF